MNSPKSSRHTGTPRRRSAIFALASTAVALRPATPKPAAPRAPKQKTPQLDAAALEEEYSVGRDYWHDKRIHNFGNVGFGGAFASMCAPLATKIIDAAAYGGRDVRAETAAARHRKDERGRAAAATPRRRSARAAATPATPLSVDPKTTTVQILSNFFN
mmetsp:Transcript_12509/g.38571  ORF Transcript_12509/g.38571 Transcript_12509/m.38571 type:complete len:159 (+) Transcript_12509:195-671(+)